MTDPTSDQTGIDQGRPRKTEMEMDAALSEAGNYLREKGFDSVAIFGTYSCNDEEENTGSATAFRGNYFANVGQVLLWSKSIDVGSTIIENSEGDDSE